LVLHIGDTGWLITGGVDEKWKEAVAYQLVDRRADTLLPVIKLTRIKLFIGAEILHG
jgi:hypothetical protein